LKWSNRFARGTGAASSQRKIISKCFSEVYFGRYSGWPDLLSGVMPIVLGKRTCPNNVDKEKKAVLKPEN